MQVRKRRHIKLVESIDGMVITTNITGNIQMFVL